MKKVLLTFVLIALAIPSFAQDGRFERAGKVNVSVMGGVSWSKNENSFGYSDFKMRGDLFKFNGQVAVGYSFTEAISGRVSIGYGKNPSAMNIRETYDGTGKYNVFAPYTFNSVSLFADAMVNLNGLGSGKYAFAPKIYVGIGGAHTSNFSEPIIERLSDKNNKKNIHSVAPADSSTPTIGDLHPRYPKSSMGETISTSNTAFGMRIGFITEYTFKSGFGIFADFCGEAFTEAFNGQHKLKGSGKGKSDFPFDLRASASLGVIMHF